MAVRSIFHWGPLVASFVICHVFYTTITSMPYQVDLTSLNAGSVCAALWILDVVAIVTFFLKAIYTGAGQVPPGWTPGDPALEAQLQHCSRCRGFKAPRSHHCKTCNGCMKKMDHHCPWINGCVGNDNHAYFLGFVSTVPVGTLYSSIVLLMEALRLIEIRGFYRQAAFRLTIVFFGVGLSIGTCLAVGGLCFIQVRSIIRSTILNDPRDLLWFRNRTGIEDWILEKANMRRPEDAPYDFPYDLGWKANVKEAISQSLYGDGITWAVREGCDQYSLTREQLAQKADKQRTKRSAVVHTDAGRCCGIGSGFATFKESFCMIAETKIQVKKGDLVTVWNFSDNWAYGQLMEVTPEGKWVMKEPRVRGWFPKSAILPQEDSTEGQSDRQADDKKDN